MSTRPKQCCGGGEESRWRDSEARGSSDSNEANTRRHDGKTNKRRDCGETGGRSNNGEWRKWRVSDSAEAQSDFSDIWILKYYIHLIENVLNIIQILLIVEFFKFLNIILTFSIFFIPAMLTPLNFFSVRYVLKKKKLNGLNSFNSIETRELFSNKRVRTKERVGQVGL